MHWPIVAAGPTLSLKKQMREASIALKVFGLSLTPDTQGLPRRVARGTTASVSTPRAASASAFATHSCRRVKGGFMNLLQVAAIAG